MKPFEIFRAGSHTAASGVTLDFGDDMLRSAVAAYDPALHEAPIVVGHPKDNHPAFGWIRSLSFSDDGKIVALPGDIDADFADLVEKGRYKKRSASWYLPDSPNNPKPGTLYLRHVGFLGAQPPAVKGLKDVAFSDTEEGIFEFVEASSTPWAWSSIAGLFRGLREWLIAEKGLETANQLLPQYQIDDLAAEANRKREAVNQSSTVIPSFSEPETNTMTPEQIAALQAENEQLKAKASQSADFAEKQADIAKREAALAHKEISAEIDGLIAVGKVLPAQKSGLVEFMASLDEADVVEFSETDPADKAKTVAIKKSSRQFMRDYLAAMPKLVDFKEHSAATKSGNDDFDMATTQRQISNQVANGGKDK